MAVTLSIIVPAYNVEKYLPQCIESMCAIKRPDIEIILVDDGATDSSGEICDRYAQKDERIKVIHKENQGVSAARNSGLRIATGKWIGFVDGDDCLQENFEETVLSHLDDAYNICIFQYETLDEQGRKGHFSSEILPDVLEKEQIKQIQKGFLNVDDKEYRPYKTSPLYYIALWNKFYQRSFIEECGQMIPETTPWGEDFVFNFALFSKVEKIKIIKESGYVYRIQSGSISNSYRKDAMHYFKMMIKELYSLVKEENEMRNYLYLYTIRQFLYTSQRSIFNKDNPDCFRGRKQEFLRYRNQKFVEHAVHHMDGKQFRPSVRVGVYLLKYRCFFLLDCMYRLKNRG